LLWRVDDLRGCEDCEKASRSLDGNIRRLRSNFANANQAADQLHRAVGTGGPRLRDGWSIGGFHELPMTWQGA
jgi:hypothetical protein